MSISTYLQGAPMTTAVSFDILAKPHPWNDADWAEYFRVRRLEEARQRYVSDITDELARADQALALVVLEHERALVMTGIKEEMRQAVIAEIEIEMAAQRARVDYLVGEMDR